MSNEELLKKIFKSLYNFKAVDEDETYGHGYDHCAVTDIKFDESGKISSVYFESYRCTVDTYVDGTREIWPLEKILKMVK